MLLADDYEPRRRCVSSLLLKYSGLQIIGEVSDGLNVVMKAEELKPIWSCWTLACQRSTELKVLSGYARLLP